jgi:hypothetical protein
VPAEERIRRGVSLAPGEPAHRVRVVGHDGSDGVNRAFMYLEA